MAVKWFQGSGTGSGSATRGTILGTNVYNPAVVTNFGAAFPAAATEVSAPNNRLTFTVPASRRALVHLYANTFPQTAGGGIYAWELYNVGTGLQVGVTTGASGQTNPTDNVYPSVHALFVLDTLPIGMLTLAWYHVVKIAGTGFIFTGGGNYAPMVMYAQAL